jgi:hypothetical protein
VFDRLLLSFMHSATRKCLKPSCPPSARRSADAKSNAICRAAPPVPPSAFCCRALALSRRVRMSDLFKSRRTPVHPRAPCLNPARSRHSSQTSLCLTRRMMSFLSTALQQHPLLVARSRRVPSTARPYNTTGAPGSRSFSARTSHIPGHSRTSSAPARSRVRWNSTWPSLRASRLSPSKSGHAWNAPPWHADSTYLRSLEGSSVAAWP